MFTLLIPCRCDAVSGAVAAAAMAWMLVPPSDPVSTCCGVDASTRNEFCLLRA